MSPWPCPPDNRVRDFNGLANPLPCLSARGHAFTGCTEVRIDAWGDRTGWCDCDACASLGCAKWRLHSFVRAVTGRGWRTRGWSLRSVLPEWWRADTPLVRNHRCDDTLRFLGWAMSRVMRVCALAKKHTLTAFIHGEKYVFDVFIRRNKFSFMTAIVSIWSIVGMQKG